MRWFLGWCHISSLHRSDEVQEGRNSYPLLRSSLNFQPISPCMHLKGQSQLFDCTDLDTSFSYFEKSSPQTEIKEHLEFRFNLRSVLLDFQSFTEKPLFECSFAHPIILFFIIFGWDRVSMICKLNNENNKNVSVNFSFEIFFKWERVLYKHFISF